MANAMRGTAARRWRERLARWRTSGFSVREFCRQEGVSQPSFYHWRKRLGRGSTHVPELASPVFVPVEVVNSTTDASRPAVAGLVEPAGRAILEVVLPRGVTLRIGSEVDESRLRSVLRVVVAETGGGC